MKKGLLLLMLSSALLLQGCTSTNKEAYENNNDRFQNLQLCLKTANALVKLDKKYQRDYSKLYSLIDDAKSYASISSETSENTKLTLSSFFEFKISDECNTISQLLIQEYKNKVKVAETESGSGAVQ